MLTLVAACSGTDTVNELPPPEDTGSSPIDVDAPNDTTVDDGAVTDSTTVDSAPGDSGAPDTVTPVDSGATPSDVGPLDVGTTFACGTETCGSSFQFCRRATSPGICPGIDAGICPAGCPGCPPLTLKCEALPMKCWAKPSCACILVEVCGSVAAGDCMEKDSGFVAGCRGV